MKRYQVFISSTFNDLIKERNIIRNTLHDMSCFPVGMEDFPALDLQQFEYIKRQIDESDYFVLVLGGHVGTICDETNESFTYMEYKYAVEKHLPVIVIIKYKKNKKEYNCKEKSDDRKTYYDKFYNEVTKDRMCKPYYRKSELSGIIHSSLETTIKEHPMPGWRKNDNYMYINDENLLLMGKLADSFMIGREIFSVDEKYYYFNIPENAKKTMFVKYGIDQIGYKLLIVNNENTLNAAYIFDENDIVESDSEKAGTLDNKIQISLAKMGNIDEYLLFLSIGDGCSSMETHIFRYGDMGFDKIAKISGQNHMYVDYDLRVPYGSQGLFERFVYCNNEILAVDDSINLKEEE